MRILRPGNRIITIGGSTRVISPRGGAAIPWYLAGGVSAANCIAAYQPIGAASYAASKVNLVDPGTYDMTEGSEPPWDATDGWKFDGSTYLKTTLAEVVNTGVSAYIVRLKVISTNAYIFGNLSAFTILYNVVQLGTAELSSAYASQGDVVVAVVGSTNLTTQYRNGSSLNSGASTHSDKTNMVIGVGARGDNGGGKSVVNVMAAVMYRSSLTSDQVSAISTAMAAL